VVGSLVPPGATAFRAPACTLVSARGNAGSRGARLSRPIHLAGGARQHAGTGRGQGSRPLSVGAPVVACILHGLCEDKGDTMRDAVFAVHFFNWYWTSTQRPLPEIEKEWTFHPAWEEMGILPEEIGHTKNYYQRQFERIRQAGFDA